MTGKTIVIGNIGIEFDGRSISQGPLGGVETAIINLAEALVRRGHSVQVANNCDAPLSWNGVNYTPLRQGLPLRADLYVPTRQHHQLLLKVPFARRRALWLHNPAWETDQAIIRAKLAVMPTTTIVVLGQYHQSTCPAWLRKYRMAIIPLGLPDLFLREKPYKGEPVKRAVFTSNPTRNLDWLLRVWVDRIHPRVPDAELHLFSGPEVYKLRGSGVQKMNQVLSTADSLVDAGIVRHKPCAREELASFIARSRVMLYRGHQDETFCLALAEAQALGIPCVVQPLGSAPERVAHNRTGFVDAEEEAFALHATELLSDDALFARMRNEALALQRSRSWDRAAQDFEQLMD
jgi:glycosyltransferase involved in cell wall biosynthesis